MKRIANDGDLSPSLLIEQKKPAASRPVRRSSGTALADKQDLEMNRKVIAILLLQVALICSACGSRENAFQKKRICAELGRQRLALDRRKDETESAGVTHAVRAEWCFSTELNTCIYSSTDDVVVTPGPNAVASIVMSTQSTIDLLTNRKLIFIERAKARRPELEEYERRRSEFFGKCQ